jgi:hypothetical protein
MESEPKEVTYELLKTEPTTAVATPEQFPLYGGMLTPELLQKAEMAVEGVKKIKAIAFKVTNHKDWLRMGGNAYLTESGCKKVGMLFGVSYRDAKVATEDRMEGANPVRQYTAKVRVFFNGREVEEIGTCDSNYDLYRWAGKDDQGNKIECPFSERDFTSMQKHALTNAMNRALKSILGLNGITWEEVQAALGQQAGKTTNVGFDKGGTAAPKQAQTVEGTDTRKQLWGMLLDLADGDEGTASAGCKKYSAFEGKDKDGKAVMKSFDNPMDTRISEKWIGSTYGKVKKIWCEKGFDKIPPPPEDIPDEPGMNG